MVEAGPDSKTQMTSVRVHCGIHGYFEHLKVGALGHCESSDKGMLQGEDQVEHKLHQRGRQANQGSVEATSPSVLEAADVHCFLRKAQSGRWMYRLGTAASASENVDNAVD
ncbi:MAG: hypothetical protein QOC62_1030 [Mycobacterium sp.]|nr:hypothetical protein [Mycobacterium sp.]